MNPAKRYLSHPAIRLPDGTIVEAKRGFTHADIIDGLRNHYARVEHGFIGKDGGYVSRPQARKEIKERTGRNVGAGHPASEDLMKKMKVKGPKGQAKVRKVMHEFKVGGLHSGSKQGPKVKDRSQAIAIALSQGRKAMKKKAPAKKKKSY